MRNKSILIIEDDSETRKLIATIVTQAGGIAQEAADGDEALQKVERIHPDLILLDIMLPGLSGWQVFERLQEQTNAPVIFLSALDDDQHIIRGLEYGAYDYITKPFSADVLIARIRTALKRTARSRRSGSGAYADGYLRIDPHRQLVTVNEKLIHLTKTEFDLLLYMASHPNRLISTSQILAHVWGRHSAAQSEYLHVYMSRLRHKLEPNPNCPQYLLTEHGRGYRFQQQ